MLKPRPRRHAFSPAKTAASTGPAAAELHGIAHYLASAKPSEKFFSERARLENLLQAALDRGNDAVVRQALTVAARAHDDATFKYLQDTLHNVAQTVELAGAGYAKLVALPLVLIEVPELKDGTVSWEKPLARVAEAFHATGLLQPHEKVTFLSYVYHPDELGLRPPSNMRKIAHILSSRPSTAGVEDVALLAQTGWPAGSAGAKDAEEVPATIRFLLGIVTCSDKERDPFNSEEGRGHEVPAPAPEAMEKWRMETRDILAAEMRKAEGKPGLVVGEPGLFYDTFTTSIMLNKLATVDAQAELILEDADADDVTAVVALYQDEEDATRRAAGISFIARSEVRLLGTAFVEVFQHEVGEGVQHLLAHISRQNGAGSVKVLENIVPLRHCDGCGATLCLGPDDESDGLTLVHPDNDNDDDGLDMAEEEIGTLGVTPFEALAAISDMPPVLEEPALTENESESPDEDAEALLEAAARVVYSADAARADARRKKLYKLVAKHLKAGRDDVIELALRDAADERDYGAVVELDAAAERLAQECTPYLGKGSGEVAGVLVAVPVLFPDVRNLMDEVPAGKHFDKFTSSLGVAVGLESEHHLQLQRHWYSPAELARLKWSHLATLNQQLTKIAAGVRVKTPLVLQPPPVANQSDAKEPVPGIRYLVGVVLYPPDEDAPEIFPVSPGDAPRWMRRITKWRAAAQKTLIEALGGISVAGSLTVLAAREYFSAVIDSLEDFKEFSVQQQLAAVFRSTGIDAKNVEVVLATYTDDDDEDAPMRSVATLTSILDNSQLGALVLDVSGYEDSEDTQGIVYGVLEEAGVQRVRSIDDILPVRKCDGCGGPLYLVPGREEEGFALGHTGEEPPHRPTLH